MYSLAEFQAGHATTIKVIAEGTSFGITDDGRGHSSETGNTISAKISPRLQEIEADTLRLESWLLSVLASGPSLKLFFNGRELQPRNE